MKLIIDIPDEIRKSIFDDVYCGIIDKRVFDAIKHGTPLPEVHGRLIDADLLKYNMKFVCMGVMAGSDTFDEPLNEIDRAETIIEADKDVDVKYQKQIEQFEHDTLYEPTFNPKDGSM